MGRKLGKNKKRSWKQVDIADVEDKLEQDRLNERVGVDSDAFVINTVGQHVDQTENDLPAKKRAKLADPSEIASSIYCYKSLENSSKVKPAIRPLIRKSKTKEKDPYVFVGPSKGKTSSGKLPEFFDIWQEKGPLTEEEKLAEELLPKKDVKVPSNLFQKPLLLSSVQTPDPGQSYNPEKGAYAKLVKRVVRKEKRKHAKDNKIQKRVQSVKKTAAEIDKEWMEEMSQGLNLEPEDEQVAQDEGEDGDESEDGTNVKVISKKKEKPKKKKKQNKIKTVKAKKAPTKSIKKILKEIKEEEAQAELKRKKRDAKLTARLHKPQKANNIREEDKVLVSLPGEITGSLRSTRLIGNLLKERFTSIQERNLVEVPKGQPGSKGKIKSKTWTKLSLKRGYREVDSL